MGLEARGGEGSQPRAAPGCSQQTPQGVSGQGGKLWSPYPLLKCRHLADSQR